jgi:hypothetical protein
MRTRDLLSPVGVQLLSWPHKKSDSTVSDSRGKRLYRNRARRNGSCGLQFCLRGPRDVCLAAIWVADRNVVYLYDARGERYSKLRLKNALAMREHVRAA